MNTREGFEAELSNIDVAAIDHWVVLFAEL
jgi:hypothetical protein